MKRIMLSFTALLFTIAINAQTKTGWVSTTQTSQWKKQEDLATVSTGYTIDVGIVTDKSLQQIEGVGTCFSELGWASLSVLKDEKQHK